MSGKAERDARLLRLSEATTKWADKRIEQYEKQVAINKALLKGRTGADRLASENARANSTLVVSAIDDFLLT